MMDFRSAAREEQRAGGSMTEAVISIGGGSLDDCQIYLYDDDSRGFYQL